MQKRGVALSLKPVIEIVLAVAVIAAFFSIATLYGNKEIFDKARATNDLGLTVNMLDSLPGNILFIFPYDVSKYSFDFNLNGMKTYGERSESPSVTIPFTYILKSNLQGFSVDNPKSLQMAKNGRNIFVGERYDGELFGYSCSQSKESLKDQNLQFDIRQVVPDLVTFDLVVFQIRSKLGDKTYMGCKGCSKIESIDGATTNIQLESLSEKEKFKIYFDYDSEESRNLGCYISNSLAGKFPEAKVSLIPSDELSGGRVNILLKSGSSESDTLSSALADGLRGFYG